MPEWQKTKQPGVFVRHQNACGARDGKRCNCTPSYRAQAYDPATGRRPKSPTFRNADEANGWLVDYKRGTVKAPTPRAERRTLLELWEEFHRLADQGAITRKGRQRYSDRTLYSYKSCMDKHVLPDLGGADAASLTIRDWQALVERLYAKGCMTNTVNNILNPVRAIYRWACAPQRGYLQANEIHGVELHAPDETARMRFATADEAAALIATLPNELDRLAYGLAFYAGLRRREIRPCTWEWIDLDAGVIDVRESKTDAGVRKVPIADPLRKLLLEAKMAAGNPPAWQYVVPGERSGGMFSADALLKRTAKTWAAASMEPIGLHDCRHTYASWMIAAGVNFKALMTFMGHTSITVTIDRYGHLLPGSEAEAADLLNEYLQRRAS